MKHFVSVTCCALLVSSISLSYAAEVPSGTVLAEKQELVRHIKDEPASLIPLKPWACQRFRSFAICLKDW